MENTPTENQPPLCFSPDGAAQRIGIRPRSIYSLMKSGEIKSFKIGKRRLISDQELQSFIKKLDKSE